MKSDKLDVGFFDDAIFCLSNMVALENHSINSYLQTKKKVFLEIAEMTRKDRSKLLYKLVKENNGEGYCMSKHTLAVGISMKELGNRFLEEKDFEMANELFEKAGLYENLFKLINDKEEK
jgi:hypothetical protein